MPRSSHHFLALCILVVASGCEAFNKYLERSKQAKERSEQAKERSEAEAEGDEYRASGPDFSVVVPDKYHRVTDERVLASVGAGGFALAADSRAQPEWFLASIAFARSGGPGPADEATCKQAAAELATMTKATVERAGLVELAGAPTCQWDVIDQADANRGATGTVMKSPSATWVVTCNRDIRDAAAKAACAKVLQGWKNQG